MLAATKNNTNAADRPLPSPHIHKNLSQNATSPGSLLSLSFFNQNKSQEPLCEEAKSQNP
jgi:hypothetical protein